MKRRTGATLGVVAALLLGSMLALAYHLRSANDSADKIDVPHLRKSIATAKDYVGNGNTLYTFTFAQKDAASYPEPSAEHPGRFTLAAKVPDMGMSPTLTVESLSSTDDLGRCPSASAKKNGDGEECTPLPNQSGTLVITKANGTPSQVRVRMAVSDKQAVTISSDLSAMAAKDPITYAEFLVRSLVTYNPNKWSAEDIYSALNPTTSTKAPGHGSQSPLQLSGAPLSNLDGVF